MVEEKKCPECGSKNIGKGKFMYEAKPIGKGKFFTSCSDVLVDLCTNCGLIITLRVDKPEKFK
ncbi:transcription initiation factor TFIIIB [Paranoxybacillus vitaminiphilus]|uniref:transcription initiation factor TFIIIB n=1 Tax=Paranoxybacillus vitaminiphilus TaxID=581036 RepID=UPI0015EB8ABD|nr:transcription initiation factor TFIIIB [Anoxybacillus vitaminiphilus]